ncbi:uncharacterized protein [Nicotiana sylvestris]|uniref:Uncharacterized protein LOC104213567 isoform X1 n=1 Tax=Nicotiana sylvestris TaxID=4096 RepID=A0A1U7V4T2_NICSY|nr:PREDICTED: uncharacterized protein LOC104213567 isoform X1 [Nicotiana sylvestris]
MSIVPISIAVASDLDTGHSEADQMFDKNPQGELSLSQTDLSSDAKELLNECIHHGEDGEFKVSATSILEESFFNTRNDPKADDAYSNAHFIAPPIVVNLVADKSAGLPFPVTQMLGGNTKSIEIDFLDTLQPKESADKDGEWLRNIADIVFDKSLELKATKLQCQLANVAPLETAKYVSTEILSAHFDEPTWNEGMTSLFLHTSVAHEDDKIVEFLPYIFKQPSLTLVLDTFRDLAMNLKYVLHTCNCFDTGQHASNEVVSTLLTTKRRKDCHLYSAHRKGTRDIGLPICGYVDSCFATGQVLWACFNMIELYVSSLLRQVQLIGYPHVFQVLDIAVVSSRCKPSEWRADPVNSLQIQHFRVKCNGCKGFRPSRLLLLLLASDEMVDSTPAHSERHDFIDPGANFFIVTSRANADLYVWDLGINSASLALTGCIENVAALIFMGCTGKFCFITFSNSKTGVWDPGQPWFVNYYNSQSNFALSVSSLPKLTHFNIIDWTCMRSQDPSDIALNGSYSSDDTNNSFLPCSLKIPLFLRVANFSGELLLAKGDTTLLRNIIYQSTQVAILGDILELGPTEFTFNELMLQFCCDARFNVTAPIERTENINCAEEIKLLCFNDAHCPESKLPRRGVCSS